MFLNRLVASSLLFAFVAAGLGSSKTPDSISARRNLTQEARNKDIVVDFYQRLFGKGDLSVIDKYLAVDYIQHNPNLADGKEAVRQMASTFPPGYTNVLVIERIAAENDLVWLHIKGGSGSGQNAFVDIFRVKNNMIVEHFDVIQPMPTTSANPHPMFSGSDTDYKSQCQFVRK